LTHGGIVGAWDILDVSQYNDVNPDAPGIIRSRAIVLGQTEAGAATDHAIVKANEGISVVEVDNGSFATYTALNLAALKVWNGALKGQLILDFLGVLDADTRISSLGWISGSDQRSHYRHSYHFGRWKAQYRCFP
jgi:hypothetical protein